MNSKIIRAFVLFTAIFVINTSYATAAVVPAVVSFTASPQSINYGYSVLLAWNITDASGYSLYFTCPAIGVAIKKDDGTAFPCNTKQAATQSVNDSAAFYIANVTGNLIVLPVKIIPKDSLGVDYDAGAVSLNINVGTVPRPISDFSYSTTISDGSTMPISLTWTGVEIGGTNLQFDCKDGIKIYSTNPATTNALTCGQPAYTIDLPASGSASAYFVNNTDHSIDQTIKIFPAISAGVYDATHAQSITVTVPIKPLAIPSAIANFSSSQTLLASGQGINLFWTATNAPGVNLQMSCDSSVVWNAVTGTSTTPLRCGVPGFSSALSASGTTTVSFANNSGSILSIPISIYPQNVDGTYDGTKARVVIMRVLPVGYVDTSAIPQTTTPATAPTGATVTTNASSTKAISKITFTLSLRLGSKNAQVSALQAFLKQDSTIYPEGLVTGYLGNASVAAIKRFQLKYRIAKPGDAGYGNVGPMTRAKLNSIQAF